jgi:hypothetical protein
MILRATSWCVVGHEDFKKGKERKE